LKEVAAAKPLNVARASSLRRESLSIGNTAIELRGMRKLEARATLLRPPGFAYFLDFIALAFNHAQLRL